MSYDSIFYAILLGIVQGITEFLPVSSSAHLILLSSLYSGETLPLSLNIALHIGTLFAVLIYFRHDWLALFTSLRRFVQSKHEPNLNATKLFPALVIGTLPAGLIGLSLKDYIESSFHDPRFVIYPLAVVGVLLWLVDSRMKSGRSLKEIGIKEGLFIGVAQSIALIPGSSRSGMTIIGARLLGFDRDSAARFSFMLGTPAMLGAALLEIKDITHNIWDPVFFIGVIVSAIVGVLSIHFLLAFFKRFGLLTFAIYRVTLAVVLFIVLD